MSLANYSTSMSVDRSLGLIQRILAESGAEAIMVDYEQKEPAALSFRLRIDGLQMGFRLPANWKGVLSVLNKDAKIPYRLKCNEDAKKVAWRTIHDWLRAQIALVQSGSASLDQVMLPYAVMPSGGTVYEALKLARFEQLALPAPQT